MISSFQSPIIFLNYLKLDSDLILSIVISELKVRQQKLCILIVLYLKLISFFVVTFKKISLPRMDVLMTDVKTID